MVANNPNIKSKDIKSLQESMGLSQDEAVTMILAQKSGKLNALREDRQLPERTDIIVSREQDVADARNDTDKSEMELKPPEEEVKEEVPINELDIAKQLFANANSDDFKSVDSPAGQAITLDAKAHPGLAKQGIGYDSWLVIRGPLVAKSEDELIVGMGRAIVIVQPE